MIIQDRHFLAAIIESSEDAIIGKSPQGIVLSWNQGAERLYGYTAAEAIGRHISFLVPPERLSELDSLLARAKQGERIESLETERLTKGGAILRISLSLAPVRDEVGRIVGSAAIARDITRQARERADLERERARLVVSQRVARVGSWEWDLATGAVSWSDETFRLYGVDPRALSPSFEVVMAFVHPDDRALFQETIRTALEERRGYSIEHRIRRPDGSVRVMSARAEVALDEELSVVRMYGTTQDITENRVLEGELRRQRETLQLSALATNDAIWDWDIASGRLAWNDGLRAYGYPAAEVGPDIEWWTARIYPEDHDRVEQALATFFASSEMDWSDGYRFRRSDGTYATVLDRGHLVRDAAGAPRRMVGSMLDVTERDRVQEAARRSAASAELLSRASHELRTPLNAILGFTDLLEQRLDATLGTRERRYVQNIRGSGEHLLSLIDRLLLLAKADSGRLELQRTVFALPLLVKSVETFVAHQAAAAGVGFTVSSPVEASVRVDRERLTGALCELLTNAITATPAGGTVELRANVVAGDLILEVSDTGRGIPPDARDRVFAVFESIHDGESIGTGLGLALCRDMVELHDGRITFESEPGRGTTFRISIPQAGWLGGMGERVLIVEDDANDADLAMTVCADAGLRCELVGTVAAALDAIRRDPPRAAVVDLHLPDGGGEAIRDALLAADASVCVLIVSAEPDAVAMSGADAGMVKPIDPAELRTWLLVATATEVPA